MIEFISNNIVAVMCSYFVLITIVLMLLPWRKPYIEPKEEVKPSIENGKFNFKCADLHQYREFLTKMKEEKVSPESIFIQFLVVTINNPTTALIEKAKAMGVTVTQEVAKV